jgi:hypothetical protein
MVSGLLPPGLYPDYNIHGPHTSDVYATHSKDSKRQDSQCLFEQNLQRYINNKFDNHAKIAHPIVLLKLQYAVSPPPGSLEIQNKIICELMIYTRST